MADAENGEKDEEGEDDENDEHGTTSNFNKTSGQISMKDAESSDTRFVVSLLDRILRNRDRYLVNPKKHPGYQIEDVAKTVI